MSNVEWLRIPTDEEAILNRRSHATIDCYDIVRSGENSLKTFPGHLIMAFECEAWKERLTPNKAMTKCESFLEWVTAPFPKGIETTVEIVETILTNAKDKATAAKALLLFDEAKRRRPGEGQPRDPESGKMMPIVDIIHDREERPSGTSAAAGLRKLQKHASEGKEGAARELAEVLDGRKSVHAACLSAGLRNRIDPDVKARCDQANAERAVECMSAGVLEAFVSDLFAAGHKSLAVAIKNLTGECTFDKTPSGRP